MDTIHIVTGYDILGNHTDIIAVFLHTRIQDKQIVVSKTAIGLANGNMVIGQLMGGLGLCTEGVNPCVQLHIALVALVDHPLQGIPIRIGGLTLCAGQESAPRLNLTLVERIALGAHLEDNHVYAILLQLVQLIGKRLLHLLGTKILELSVYTLYPGSAHFSLLSPSCHRQHQGESHQ